ncbi:MAG TPA: PilN domain-containing protein [Candidatus Saccharimonadales bacterium]
MINLLPRNYKANVKFGRYNVRVVRYTLLSIILGTVLVGILYFGLLLASREERLLKDLVKDKQSGLDQYAEELTKAKTLAERIDVIAALLERETSFSKLLPAIGGVVPQGTTISSLELTNEVANNLSIRGESNSELGPTVFRENLANTTDLFEQADIVSISLIQNDSGPDRYAFQIDVKFTPGAKQELKR